MELLPVVFVENVVHVGVDELLLFVLQVLRHIVRHEHDAALPVHHKQEAVQRLLGQRQEVITDGDAGPFLREGWAHLQQKRPQVVLVYDSLTSRGHV